MIEIKKLSYSVPEKDLYNNISITIEENVHYAFIGGNGTGKSTLMDMIIHGDKYLYDGKIIFDESALNTRIGYVSQFSGVDNKEDMTVYDFISDEFIKIDNRIAQLCEKMAAEENLDEIFEE